MKTKRNNRINRFRNIQPRLLGIHLLVTVAYPIARTVVAEEKKLLILTDALPITGLILIIAGVMYALYLKGDFDISRFVFLRGARRKGEEAKPFQAFQADQKEKREAAFNYPLFLGILYLAASVILAWGVL